MLLFRLKAEATRPRLAWLRRRWLWLPHRSVWLPALAGRLSQAFDVQQKTNAARVIAFSCIATGLTAQSAQAPTPAVLENLSQARTITEADCSAARVGDAIPASAIGEPVGAVTLAAPRWVAATDSLQARCEVDGSIEPVDRSATARPIRFRAWLPADWNGRAVQQGGGGMNGSIPDLLETMGRQAVDRFARLFVIPQAGHGLTGAVHGTDGDGKATTPGAIASGYERFAYLISWVERRVAPGKALEVSAGGRTMPLCSYPEYPKYINGSPTTASSYTCTAPD